MSMAAKRNMSDRVNQMLYNKPSLDRSLRDMKNSMNEVNKILDKTAKITKKKKKGWSEDGTYI